MRPPLFVPAETQTFLSATGVVHCKKKEASPMERHYDFVQNRACEFFPCHPGIDPEKFNCLFCYCPLYALGDRCGGHFQYTAGGIKDCSACLRPHIRENYDKILEKMPEIMALAQRKAEK